MSNVRHLYFPAPGQTDAAERAAALEAEVVRRYTDTILGLDVVAADGVVEPENRYAGQLSTLPAVVCDHGDEGFVVIPEPTTLEAVGLAHAALEESHYPITMARVTDVETSMVDALVEHSAAVNPHSIVPGTIGAADASHTHAAGGHSHVDADLPSGLARDAEVAAMYAPIHAHPYSSDTHNHDTTYAVIHSHPYAATSHAHIDADIPATIARDAEVAAAYSPLAHTHAIPSAGVIRKTANQTMTLTAQTAVTDMSFPVAANGIYYFAMTVRVTTSSGTSPTTAWGFTGPAAPTAVAISSEQDTSTSIEVKGLLTAFGNLAAGAQVANTGAEFRGVIQNGPNAGTVQLTVARAGTNPSMVVAAGSNGYWIRVA